MSENSNGPTRKIVPAALILGAASLASRLVGLIRERVLTTTFGAGDTLDAFVAAFRVPDVIFNLVVIGALSAAFIPLFTEKLVKKSSGQADAFRFATTVLNTLLIVVIGCSGLFALFAPVIIPLITPGFAGEKMQLTIMLTRIMALQPALLTISFIFSGVLNSFKRFVVYALAPIVYNLGIIFGVIVLYPAIGTSGLGWGVVMGAALHMLVQLPSAWRVGWRWRPWLNWRAADVRTLLHMMLPRVFGLAAQQINLLVATIIGSSLLAGSVSVFYLANNVQSLPIGIFGLAFAQAAFPSLAEYYSRGLHHQYRSALTRTFRYILFFVVPLSLFFFLLRAQIVRVLFGDGAFDWEDTILTYRTFGWLLISIFAQATIPLLARAFYVQKNTRTPVLVSLISIVVSTGLTIYLAPRLGVIGLAVAFSAGAIVNMTLLLGVLHWQLKGFDDREVLMSLVRIVVAAIVGAIFLQFLKYPVAALVDMQRFWGVFIQLVVAGAGGVAAYLYTCWLLASPEIIAVKKYLPRRWQPPTGTDTTRFGGSLD